MSTQAEFLDEIRDALNRLYDYPYLETHPLALRYWPDGHRGQQNRAQLLQRLLLETIEEVNPPALSAQNTVRAQAYAILAYRFVEGRVPSQVIRELGCSRRQFFRLQREALNLLAGLLWAKLPVGTPILPRTGDLLDVEAERVLAERETVDIKEVVQGALEAISHLASQHGVKIERDIEEHLPLVSGNRTLWRQVYLKVLSHLISAPGTRRVCLRIWSQSDKVGAEFASEPGVPSGLHDSLEMDYSAALAAEGRLVRLMGGEWYSLDVGARGFCCRFTMAVHGQRTFLVVEDNPAVIRAFQRYLVGYDYNVVGATTGAEAIQLARQLLPAAIALDLMMPKQDGWETLHALKGDTRTCHIPVIICSVLDDPALARSFGAAAYLRKPVTQADLLSALSALTHKAG